MSTSNNNAHHSKALLDVVHQSLPHAALSPAAPSILTAPAASRRSAAGADPAAATGTVSRPTEPALFAVGPASQCKSLVLSDRGYEHIRGFDEYLSLQVLYLNGNRLARIAHLDNCIRLKELYVARNRITTAQGSLKRTRFLEVLDLSDNRLRDLEQLLKDIGHLQNLKDLNLSNNPVAQEENYREQVLDRFPRLEILDSHRLTDRDRDAVRAWKQKMELLEQKQQAMMSTAASSPKTSPAKSPQINTRGFGRTLPRESQQMLVERKISAKRQQQLFKAEGLSDDEIIEKTLRPVSTTTRELTQEVHAIGKARQRAIEEQEEAHRRFLEEQEREFRRKATLPLPPAPGHIDLAVRAQEVHHIPIKTKKMQNETRERQLKLSKAKPTVRSSALAAGAAPKSSDYLVQTFYRRQEPQLDPALLQQQQHQDTRLNITLLAQTLTKKGTTGVLAKERAVTNMASTLGKKS